MKIILNRALSMVTTDLWDAVLTIFILTLLSSVQTVAISTDSFIRLSKYLYIHPSICSSIHSFISWFIFCFKKEQNKKTGKFSQELNIIQY